MQNRRAAIICSLSVALLACTTPKNFDPKDLPPLVALQDPPEGKAIVYLLRAPHDSATLPVFLGGKKVAVLEPSTYTAAVLDPGTCLLASSPLGRSEDAPASTLTVQAGERRFLYVSAPTSKSASLSSMYLNKVGVIPLVLPVYGANGARTWKECSELDAQGFMSIGRPVRPEPGAA
jgi:hypothetical protein